MQVFSQATALHVKCRYVDEFIRDTKILLPDCRGDAVRLVQQPVEDSAASRETSGEHHVS